MSSADKNHQINLALNAVHGVPPGPILYAIFLDFVIRHRERHNFLSSLGLTSMGASGCTTPRLGNSKHWFGELKPQK